MSNWHWPQWVAAIFILSSTLRGFIPVVRDRSMSSGMVTFAMFLQVALTIGWCAVLSAGGFW